MNWGSREEVYRHKCMQILNYRYCYYVLHSPLISDIEYDKLEHELENFEEANLDLVHENSPTKKPGSSQAKDYPRSIINLHEIVEEEIATLW